MPLTSSAGISIKDICNEFTAYGFSYKWGNYNPIIQPWRLVEGKARKIGMYFEGERVIRDYWEKQVRAKLPDTFYKKKDLNSEAWVTEARRRCGFDTADFKDRFTTLKKKPADGSEGPLPSSNSSSSSRAADEDEENAAQASDEEPSQKKKKPAVGRDASTAAAPGHDESSEADASEEKADEGKAAGKPKKAEVLQELPVNLDDVFRDGVFDVRKAHELLFGPRKDGKEGSQQSKGKKRKKPSSYGDTGGKGGGNKAKGGEEKREGGKGNANAAKQESDGQPGTMRIAGADMGAQDQADLFETLFAKAPTLTTMQLDHATKLLQKGDPQVIGLLKAYTGKDDAKGLVQFKRLLDTIICDARVYGKHR